MGPAPAHVRPLPIANSSFGHENPPDSALAFRAAPSDEFERTLMAHIRVHAQLRSDPEASLAGSVLLTRCRCEAAAAAHAGLFGAPHERTLAFVAEGAAIFAPGAIDALSLRQLAKRLLQRARAGHVGPDASVPKFVTVVERDALAQRIASAAARKRVSLAALARMAGVSDKTIRGWMSRHPRHVRTDHLHTVAAALAEPPDYLRGAVSMNTWDFLIQLARRIDEFDRKEQWTESFFGRVFLCAECVLISADPFGSFSSRALEEIEGLFGDIQAVRDIYPPHRVPVLSVIEAVARAMEARKQNFEQPG